MTNDQIIVSRELLRQALGALEQQNVIGFSGTVSALRTLLDAPAVEPEQRKAPCARQCEAQAFRIEIRQLTCLVTDYMEIIAKQRVAMKEAHRVLGTLDVSITSRTLGARCCLADAMDLGISAPQAQQPGERAAK